MRPMFSLEVCGLGWDVWFGGWFWGGLEMQSGDTGVFCLEVSL